MTFESLPDVEGSHQFHVSAHGAFVDAGSVASEMWVADLDHDGRDDIAIRYVGTCGNHGDCVLAVYAACGENRFAIVLDPEYRKALGPASTETEANGASWTDLLDGAELRRFDGRVYR